MLTVAHVFQNLGPGGAERLITDLLCALDPNRVRAIGIATGDVWGGSFEAQLERAGIPVHYLRKGLGFRPRAMRTVWQILRDERVDVVHSHMHTHVYALPALFRLGLPGVHTLHTLCDRENRMVQRANALGFRFGVVPVAASGEVARSARQVYGRDPVVVRNAIPAARFTADRAKSRRAYGVKGTVVVSVARLVPVKGHPGLLRAVAQVPDCTLLLAGQGPDEEALKQLATDLAISDRVRFLGAIEDVPGVLAASDVFVLNSRFEGLPLSVLEAQAAGLPVIATAVGGVPEVVADDCGRLVPLDDEAALVAALRELVGDRATRARLGAAARARAHAYDLSDMARAYEAVYAAARPVRPRLRLRA